MAQATFLSGNYGTTKHTPSGAVAAGDVIVSGGQCFVAHHPIAANVQGSVAQVGGVYRAAKVTGSGTGFVKGTKVYWDDTNDEFTETSGGNTPFGFAAETAGDDDETADALHHPF